MLSSNLNWICRLLRLIVRHWVCTSQLDVLLCTCTFRASWSPTGNIIPRNCECFVLLFHVMHNEWILYDDVGSPKSQIPPVSLSCLSCIQEIKNSKSWMPSNNTSLFCWRENYLCEHLEAWNMAKIVQDNSVYCAWIANTGTCKAVNSPHSPRFCYEYNDRNFIMLCYNPMPYHHMRMQAGISLGAMQHWMLELE